VASVFPDLLGTYGDGGNALVLAQRLRWRQLPVEQVTVTSDAPVPAGCDVYLLGGGEDAPQGTAVDLLRHDHSLAGAVERGAVVLAVCAGFQLLGESLEAAGQRFSGVGLVDVRTRRGPGGRRRAVGDLVVRPRPDLRLPELVGFENHGGLTELGPDVQPLGAVLHGVGNGHRTGRGDGAVDGAGDGAVDGAVCGSVFCTYLHGPVLALNPALADLLLSRVVGPLPPLDDTDAAAARELRLSRRHRGAAR
jgi:CobQ-like glutamine amidotransferase family enzyme